MSKLPRILPLIGVAIAGVLAVNALAGARNLPDMVSAAKAMADGITKPSKAAKAPKTSESAETPKAASPLPPSEANTQLAMASAPTVQIPANADALCLASRAGLSPNEMKMIQDLQSRRGELDQRETDLDTQVKLVEAAEAKLNAKLDQLNGLKGDINKLLGQVDDKQAAENARLIKVYSVMKPAKAAADHTMISVVTELCRLQETPSSERCAMRFWCRSRARLAQGTTGLCVAGGGHARRRRPLAHRRAVCSPGGGPGSVLQARGYLLLLTARPATFVFFVCRF